MKITSKLKSDINNFSVFAHNSIEWVWAHENKDYKLGGFESVYHAITKFIYENSDQGINFTIRDIEIALKLNSVKHCPKPSAIERRIIRLMKKC